MAPEIPLLSFKRAYCISFDNAAIAQIANNLVTWADLYNETSAQRCAKGDAEGKEEP